MPHCFQFVMLLVGPVAIPWEVRHACRADRAPACAGAPSLALLLPVSSPDGPAAPSLNAALPVVVALLLSCSCFAVLWLLVLPISQVLIVLLLHCQFPAA